jgi:acetylornithine/succinyldiaminopimelate/putrescine aminotransferase
MKDSRVTHQMYLINTYPFRGKSFVRSNGVHLFDDQDNKYLDVMTNYGVNIFGFNHPQITGALQDQLQTLPTLHCSFANDVRAQAAKALVQRCGGKMAQVYFANSGTEAVEAALKFAFQVTGKKEIIAMKGSYHGKTLGSLALTSNTKYKQGVEHCLLDTLFIRYADIEELEQSITDQTAAVILEPIQGESGVVSPHPGYLKQVQELCEKHDVLFIVDEIQTGVGRTGHFLATHEESVEPDIICLGKGLGGGIPVGVTVVSKKVAAGIPKLSQTSTFGGNPLACRGIIEVLNLLDENCLASIQKKGELLISELKKIESNAVVEVRGKGLMIGIEIAGDRNLILKRLQDRNILACPAGDSVVRLLPPYIITHKHIEQIVEALKIVL